MIRANANCYAFINYVLYYAQNIADSLRALDVCRANAKKPFIITCEESALNTVKQFFKKMDDNEQFIISSGIFPTDKVNISPLYVTIHSISISVEVESCTVALHKRVNVEPLNIFNVFDVCILLPLKIHNWLLYIVVILKKYLVDPVILTHLVPLYLYI